MSTLTRRIAALAAAGALTLWAGVALADDPPPIGPVYPPPGGVNLGTEGDSGRTGGVTWTYNDLELERFETLWWGVTTDGPPGLAMDGGIDEEGETMTWSAAQSDLAGGVLVFTGQAELPGHGTFPTKATIRTLTAAGAPLGMVDPGAAELPWHVGGVAVIADVFKVNALLEVNGVPAKDFFDNTHTDPSQEGQLRTSVGGAFSFVPANELPVASFEWSPTTPTAGRTVELSSTSMDPDGIIEHTAWDLDNDGEFDDATGESTSTVFETPGDHVVGVQVTDDRDGIATTTNTITVVPNEAPEASFTRSPESPKALQTVTFTSTSTDSDGTIAETAWDLDGDGEYDDATGTSASRSFPEAGEYTVGVRVTDDLGGVDTGTQTFGVRTCEPGLVSQTLRSVGALAGIEPTIRQINCDVLEPLGL